MAEWFEKRTLGSLLDDAARRFAAREALCFEGNRWTFEELRADVNRTAQGLLNLGVQAGDKVSLWMNNCPEWIYSMFAVAKIGAVLVPINTRFRTNDMEYVGAPVGQHHFDHAGQVGAGGLPGDVGRGLPRVAGRRCP